MLFIILSYKLCIIKTIKYSTVGGCTVAQLVALLPCSKMSWVQLLAGGLSAWSLHVLPVHAWVLTRYSSFLPQSKDMPVRLIGLSKLPLGVNDCVHGCLCVALQWTGDLSRVYPASHP
ncbi:hypothetical protein CHARACLAT_025262 [Characodon lateralis]|uniref:Uncharacterized protein n=1 Tax=Characodon lateralis TaxID=208331 RepID=A0ABU7DLZ1_9TELE|nr:hypothetical protein [Characodon lateralis]